MVDCYTKPDHKVLTKFENWPERPFGLGSSSLWLPTEQAVQCCQREQDVNEQLHLSNTCFFLMRAWSTGVGNWRKGLDPWANSILPVFGLQPSLPQSSTYHHRGQIYSMMMIYFCAPLSATWILHRLTLVDHSAINYFFLFFPIISLKSFSFTIKRRWLWIFSYIKEGSNVWMHITYQESCFIWNIHTWIWYIPGPGETQNLLRENHIQISNHRLSFLWYYV